MSYPPSKAIPLVVSDLDETIKMIKRRDKHASDEALEEIFLNLLKDRSDDDIKFIGETFFRLHASCQQAIKARSDVNFEAEQRKKELAKELKYKDAAIELGISVTKLKGLVKDKKLTVKHYSMRDVRITMGEIERYRSTLKPHI